jgi:hypothetical protein
MKFEGRENKKTKAKSHLPSLLLKIIILFPPQLTIPPPLAGSSIVSQPAPRQQQHLSRQQPLFNLSQS